MCTETKITKQDKCIQAQNMKTTSNFQLALQLLTRSLQRCAKTKRKNDETVAISIAYNKKGKEALKEHQKMT